MKKDLQNITLIGIDCVDLSRLQMAADICEKDFSFGAVTLLTSIPSTDPRVTYIPKISSTEAYSEFCIKELWKYVHTEYALIFQYDGFILNPLAWTDEFLQYDYIGAPWYNLDTPLVGNGGFSLRSKNLLQIIGETYKTIDGVLHPEDFWICKTARPFLEQKGIRFAPLDTASRFSKEGSVRSVVWNGEFGFHGLTYTDISHWLTLHPEYKNYFSQKLDTFTKIMQKYPVYDATVHVLQNKPIQISNYTQLGLGKKTYDCRMNDDLKNMDPILPDHTVVYKLFRISEDVVGLKAFEKKVKKVEIFSSKKDLLKKYPDISITNSFKIPKWRQHLISLFGNIFFPNNTQYTLIQYSD